MREGSVHPLRAAVSGYRLALEHKAYRRLWLAMVISRTGNTIDFAAVPLFVLALTHSAPAVATTVFGRSSPILLSRPVEIRPTLAVQRPFSYIPVVDEKQANTDPRMAQKGLNRALAILGPLEARIMRVIWSGEVGERFVVRDIQQQMSELAYTTIMTTVVRLANKGLLHTRAIAQQKAHEYRVALSPEEFVTRSSRQGAAQLVRRYGEAALVAFAARIDGLDPEQRKRLRELGKQ